ncbi:22039_t:CDS:2 [Gigaspora margarita]|uniref:22039_t:CDS:1 n=1 Tax=Gigaspora margarita TaxID=4874 RepID=A0ABN7UI29_GIGMA|nr:22039_t:CDS:2 [Gigaspora margarita]
MTRIACEICGAYTVVISKNDVEILLCAFLKSYRIMERCRDDNKINLRLRKVVDQHRGVVQSRSYFLDEEIKSLRCEVKVHSDKNRKPNIIKREFLS